MDMIVVILKTIAAFIILAVAYVAQVVGNISQWLDKGPTNSGIILVAFIAIIYLEQRYLGPFHWHLERIPGIQRQLYQLESKIKSLEMTIGSLGSQISTLVEQHDEGDEYP